jgi:lipopolysaccharide/colanic/teichoic acid biosynthesis glycosyltransferase
MEGDKLAILARSGAILGMEKALSPVTALAKVAVEDSPRKPLLHYWNMYNVLPKYHFGASLVKRAIDLAIGSLLLLILFPVLLAAAALVRLSSAGPVFYRQPRAGLNGELFMMLKFRTMRLEQAGLVDQQRVDELKSRGILYKLENDPRITWAGKWLRRSSIDELPQLFNVVSGEMSLVGPRPLVTFMLVGDPQDLARRAAVRPGITGLWQINARASNTRIDDMLGFDLDYVRRCSFKTDMIILMKTIPAVLSGNGAR